MGEGRDEMKVAMLGGSFDPVHLGHLFLLHCAVSMSDYDTFIVVPAALSNFKRTNAPKATDNDRLEMLRLALLDYKDIYPQDCDADIRLSTMELDRGGVSYTYDTVMDLKRDMDIHGRLGLIMGDDQIPSLARWYRFDDLKREVRFLVCRRNQDGALWTLMPEGVVYSKIEPSGLAPQSSSGFRADVHSRMGDLSPRVAEYVRDHDLYN